ncbi:carbohydrate ABC transporter permease [Candidatus Methylocalor cossyra]|uniref:L-arabinose transport system permease protein AraQ n=1 Tax=Candidatus Methylocalor cossyra TaxID=3108543 RepID=A0ABM9NLL3_9GAMM
MSATPSRRLGIARRLQVLALHASLLALAALALFPLLWMLSVSFMPADEVNRLPPPLLPRSPTLEHYRILFARLDIGRYALNSLAIAAAVTVLSLLFNSLAGYAFAKLRFAGRERLFALLLAGMVIPSQVAMLPLFLLLKALGLVNTYGGVIIPGLASIFGIFLIRQYALAIPDSLLDAARIDGASEFRIYFSLVLPLCRPILVTLAIFTFMGTWNDFMWPLIILTDQALYTLPVALANLLGEHAQDAELMMAGAVLTVLPVVALFLALQRHYIEGLVLGSVKE